ncbi:hypothetical protein Q9L42_004140 [Methylomarinum sp. Ch1-1]|uniref:Uncharacterized protein n=1 Tax=Methylomarinum roseum TaxID=3067653 RepID=A0AAU7NWI6_9GAMM
MSSHANHGAKGAVKAGAIATGSGLGARILGGAARHPVLLFGVGVVAGIYLHKYRQQINEASCCETEE